MSVAKSRFGGTTNNPDSYRGTTLALSAAEGNTEQNKWPCLFTKSATTGEKDFEEFFTEKEILDMNRFQNLGIIKNELENFDGTINYFEHAIHTMKERKSWTKQEIVDLFHYMIPDFGHKEMGEVFRLKNVRSEF